MLELIRCWISIASTASMGVLSVKAIQSCWICWISMNLMMMRMRKRTSELKVKPKMTWKSRRKEKS